MDEAVRRELRRQRRIAMQGMPERLGMSFTPGVALTAGISRIEMRAKPNGTAAGSNFEFTGYATVYGTEFDMWDPAGEPYREYVAPGACKRSLSNPNLDVPFLIGHDDGDIALARTRSGTMRLAEDTHGLHVQVPSMDGSLERVRQLASAVKRGDMSEMSLAFVCVQQQWDDSFERRGVMQMELNRGDVCAVVHGANSATAGVSMSPVELLAARRPVLIGRPMRERRMPTQPYERGADEHVTCLQCQSGNDADARYCDQCGNGMRPLMDYAGDPDDTQECRCGLWNAPDAKICDQCGQGLANDHDADDGYPSLTGWAAGRPLERRAAVSAADQNDLPDSDFAYIEPGGKKDAEGKTTPRSKRHFPVQDAAHVRNALARAPQSPFGGKAMPGIKAAAGKHGVDVAGQHASARPLERRASAEEDMDLAATPDYNPAPVAAGLTCPQCQAGNDGGAKFCDQCGHGFATGATVTVDDSTGIPGPETQMAAARKLELLTRELDLEELASHRVACA